MRAGIVVVAVVCSVIAATAEAATFDSATRVSQSPVSEDVTDPVAAPTATGWLTGWTSGIGAGGADRLSRQLLTAAGAEAGGPADALLDAVNPVRNVEVAFDAEHDRVLAVGSLDTASDDTVAYLLDATTGATLEGPITVDGSGGAEFNPHVAYSPVHDEYLVVYERTVSGGEDRVFGRRIEADGDLVGPQASQLSQLSTLVVSNAVTALPGGGWTVVWAQNPGAGGFGVHGQRVAPDAVTGLAETGADDFPISDTANAQETDVAADGGQLLVVWREASGREIHGRRVGADGAITTPGVQLSEVPGSDAPTYPGVAGGRPGGGWLVTWEQPAGAGFHRVAAQEVDANAGELGADQLVSPAAGDVAAPGGRRPDLTGLAHGAWLIAYELPSSDGNVEAYVQRGVPGGDGAAPDPPVDPPAPPHPCVLNPASCQSGPGTIENPVNRSAPPPPSPPRPPAPPKAGTIRLPSASRCVRTLRIKATPAKGGRARRLDVRINGRRKLRRNGRKADDATTVRGLPKRRRFRVSVTLTLADGRKVTASRSYRGC